MKKPLKQIAMTKKLIRFIAILTIVLGSKLLMAQPLPPGGGHGAGGDQVPGGGAPIGMGYPFLIVLSLAYFGVKKYKSTFKLE